MSFDSAAFDWNSVDVRGDDGLLHNGRVIDAVATGLVVDFGATGQPGPKLIPFGHVYHRHYSNYLSSLWQRINAKVVTVATERLVEVLLRLQRGDPWKWYPGMLLDPFGLVSVSLPDRQLKGVVVEQRIRQRSTEKSFRDVLLGEGRFSKQLVVIPSGQGAVPSDDQLIAVFNAHCQQENYWMMATGVHYPCHGLFKELVVLGIFDTDDEDDEDEEMEKEADKFTWPQHHGIRRECYQTLNQLLHYLLNKDADIVETSRFPSPATPYPDGYIQSLYRDSSILPQIFECLTTVQQTQLRGISRQWDAVLTSVGIRRVITVSQPFHPFSNRRGNDHDYAISVYRFTSCLYNCWTPHTRMLALYGRCEVDVYQETRLADTARLLQCILTAKSLPAVEVLLVSKEWHLGIKAANWVNALWSVFVSLAGVCRQVILRNVAVNVDLPRSVPYDELLPVVVHISNQRVTRQLTVNDFWAMLNNGLRELSIVEAENLARNISYYYRPRSHPWHMARMLNITQSLDSRDGVRYRGMTFSPYGDLDGVDVGQLTKLTLHALLHCLEGKRRIVFHIL